MNNSRGHSKTPPLKGAFPLDIHGECTDFKKFFIKCLIDNKLNNSKCQKESEAYLNCRMEKKLMEKEDLRKLGFRTE
jgi:cytochrome c oxidase assembly protein subunit 19